MLGIIVVAYKSSQMTIDYVNREMKNIDVPWVCCIVNNASTDKDTKSIAEGCKAEIVDLNKAPTNKVNGSVFILPSEKNLGFARGNNLGVQFLIRYFKLDYLLFSNNDIEIKSSNCLSTLIGKLESNDRIGAIGPRIIGFDGSVQLPHDGYVSPYRQIGWVLLPFLRRKNRNKEKRFEERVSGFTYWVQGSFLVMRLKDFLTIGMFDSHTFLYAEEPILAERLKTISKEMFYENSVTVLHYEGGTIVNKKGNIWSKRKVIESNCYYYRKYLKYNVFIVWLYKLLFKLVIR